MTLADLLFRPGPGTDPAGALVHVGGLDHSWDDIRARATDVARALEVTGVGAGHAVAVMLPDGADLVATLFGVWSAGAVYVPLNPRLTAREVEHAVSVVAPAAFVTTPARSSAAGGRPVVVLGDGDAPAPGPPVAAGARRYDDGVALVQFTSGTTGAPKPVLLTHAGIVELLDGVLAKLRGDRQGGGRPAAAAGPPRAPMPNLVPVSLSLWAGIYNVLFGLRVGAPLVLMDGFDPVEMAALVERFGIRSTVLPPAAMTMLLDDERVTDLAPLRFVRSITAPLSPLAARRFRQRFGIDVLNSYGQTEIGGEIIGWSAADVRAHGDAKLGSVGRPHRGVEVRIVETGSPAGPGAPGVTDAAPGEAGELWVRTPAMSAGYADGGDLGDRVSPDGWFRTGDVARVDDDGFVWVEGRVSDMINRGGLKVHPAEVEEVLRTSPQVVDAAVVGVPDDRLGQVPWAFVVPVAGDVPTSDALSGLCRENLTPYKVPARFSLIDALPRNDVGKVVRGPLVDQASATRTTEARS